MQIPALTGDERGFFGDELRPHVIGLDRRRIRRRAETGERSDRQPSEALQARQGL